jgi:arylsulfatase A-like enzyme
MSDDQRRLAIQGYHASTSFMDAQLGRVVDALDRLGLAGNTVIVFTSDHGYHLADHGLWMKQSLFDRAARVPLIFVPPHGANAGRTAVSAAELIDIYPTLASLCGLKAPDYLDGTDLSPALKNPANVVKKAAFSQLRRPSGDDGYSVRSSRWRYTEWTSKSGTNLGQQLFDEEKDPVESNNLAANPAYSETIKELSALILPIRNQRPPARPAAKPARSKEG